MDAEQARLAAEPLVTCTEKVRGGWQSCTQIALGHARLLRIVTNKCANGGVSTNGTVYNIHSDSISTELFGDYSKILAHDGHLRCTESAVKTQHAGVLTRIESLRDEIAAFYIVKMTSKPWVVVLNPGQVGERIAQDFYSLERAYACCKGFGTGVADVMRRRPNGTLTTEF